MTPSLSFYRVRSLKLLAKDMQAETTKYIHEYTSSWSKIVEKIKPPLPDAKTMQLHYAPLPPLPDELQNVANDAPRYAPRDIAVGLLIQRYYPQ